MFCGGESKYNAISMYGSNQVGQCFINKLSLIVTDDLSIHGYSISTTQIQLWYLIMSTYNCGSSNSHAINIML